MLRSCARRAARTAGSVLSLAPKSCSKTTRGLFSDIRGNVGVSHESVLLYAQLKDGSPQSPDALGSSTASCSDENWVLRSNSFAMIWSIEIPFSTSVSDFLICMPVRYDPEAREWSPPG